MLVGIVAVVGYMNMKDINDRMTTMYHDRLVPIDKLGKAYGDAYQIRGDLYKFVALQTERDKTKSAINEGIKNVNKDIEEYKASCLIEAEKEELKKFEAAWPEYQKNIQQVISLVESGREQDAKEFLASEGMTSSRTAVANAIDALMEINVQTADELDNEGDTTFAAATLLIVVVGIIGVLAAVLLGFVISRSITLPLKRVAEVLEEMSRGHLGHRLNLVRKDEIGVMARAMDQFSEDLQKVAIGALYRVAAGDVTVPIRPRDDQDEIAPAIMQVIANLQTLITEAKALSDAALAGNLHARADVSKVEGAYREILEGINNALEAICDPVEEAMRLSASYAQGNFADAADERLRMEGEFVRFKDALNEIGIKTSVAIGEVKRAVEQLTAGMEETNASAEEVASGTSTLSESAQAVRNLAERCTSGVQQILRAMEDLSQTVSSVAAKAESASASAQQTVELSETGALLAGKAEKGMHAIIESVDKTSEIITDISGQMDEIGHIVDVITGIAEQTGLLALNAAIEAARAGDAGLGFAVVADEVKSLALESQKSAENISAIIGNLQHKTHMVSESMKTSSEEVRNGNEAVGETLQVFTRIVQAVSNVHDQMSEVAGATEEQAAAVEEITASVNEVGTLVQQTAQESVGSAAATRDVSSSIEQISHAIADAAVSVQNISQALGVFTIRG
ncbi:methyl-accepting chemotaxis protein [Methanospirillum sp.]|uniref:methyl-accepting chemotaxis protein n=2 Tax=Methanospirillum sp. TaxID=45200 RepID=UPI002C7A436C|nr:methyl-accepting chemotaxis protein [Methanospirillum sp.]HPP77966.1 methyl-accepting chemotaxis protein [Methanospirillum sp.]